MKLLTLAALALTPAASLSAQAVPSTATATAMPVDYSTAVPIGGNWAYVATADGSEATFNNASLKPQVTIHCTRATRRVSVAKTATGAAPFLSIWTSSQTKSAPASFDPATARLTAQFAAFDPALDAIAFSRGRVALSASGSPALVVPAWSEIARVIEDCRV